MGVNMKWIRKLHHTIVGMDTALYGGGVFLLDE